VNDDPQALLLSLFYGRWRSQTLHAGVLLGVFEAVGPQPRAADEITKSLGLDAALGLRLLRALRSLGVLKEHPGRAFSATEAGAMLRADHRLSMRDAILLREGPEHTAVWKHLPAIVRDGEQNGFVREFGVPAFAHAARDRSYGDAFNAGMVSQSNLQTRWTLEALREEDLAGVRHLCDVGGGHGHLLCRLLAERPGVQRGTVLERPGVIDGASPPWAARLGVAGRCEAVAGDMFEDVPAADAYTLKMILHDWDDAECLRILGTLRRRATGPKRVLVVEHVIPDGDGPDHAALFDMHMMVWGTGRERTLQEYRGLLEGAGFTFDGVRHPASGAIGIVVAHA